MTVPRCSMPTVPAALIDDASLFVGYSDDACQGLRRNAEPTTCCRTGSRLTLPALLKVAGRAGPTPGSANSAETGTSVAAGSAARHGAATSRRETGPTRHRI